MTIQFKKDCQRLYPNRSPLRMREHLHPFSLTGGSYVNTVRDSVADHNFGSFHDDWNFNIDMRITQRNITEALARRVNLPASKTGIFQDLWQVTWGAKQYKKEVDDQIADDLEDAYDFAGRVASETPFPNHPLLPNTPLRPLTWQRITDAPATPNYVVFSDHHMMDHTSGFTLPNYFKDHNYELYLEVLGHYADSPGWCLVENGDVEECIIYEVDAGDASARRQLVEAGTFTVAGKYPILQSDEDWDAFMAVRYTKRQATLANLFSAFSDYYTLIRDRFIADQRYVRLTGNHDTYSDTERERALRDMIEGELGTQVWDVARIRQGGSISHLVLHGHQFDTVSIQSGTVPYALSLGEVFSETLSWIYEGPDRFWSSHDARAWQNGAPFKNKLARETPTAYPNDAQWNLVNAGQDTARDKIKANTKGFVESILEHEIAWEYFENTDPWYALAIEVAGGDEWFKFRHLDERRLAARYAARFLHHAGVGSAVPKLVLGHTHEPRANAVHPSDGPVPWILNSGSAGRFHNLIWAVEITPSGDRIVSWSRIGGRARKTIWRDEPQQTTISGPTGPFVVHSSQLVPESHVFL